MSEWAELIRAIAALLWPSFAFTFIFLFKRRLGEAISRVKKGKFLGQEVELNDSLISLQKSASELSEEVAAIPVHRDGSFEQKAENQAIESETDVIKLVIHEASRSPTAALILLAAEIEREAKQALATMGLLGGRKHVPLATAIRELDAHMGLPKHISSSLKLFWDTRNKLVHGGQTEERNVLSAIDSGISILKSLQAIPREKSVVLYPMVTLYSDPECSAKLEGVKGVILETRSPGGASTSRRIYPSTRTYFKKGKQVSWEWNLQEAWSQAWYRDPETNEIKSAWHSAGEFIGRHLDEL